MEKTNWWGAAGTIGIGALVISNLLFEPEKQEFNSVESFSETREMAKPIVMPIIKETSSVQKEASPTSNCHPSYSGCLKQNAGDYDCESGTGNGPNYTGPVQVYGSDPFDLDRDGDGWACERS